ncbi:MAG: hypothetical protein HY059_05990 [Proteobacteria bacterium]|nr:hypothetical protein [Pseudomonadota bacterium]
MTFAELCALYGICRVTGYKWLARAERSGLDFLEELSRRPHSCPHATPAESQARLLGARRAAPRGQGDAHFSSLDTADIMRIPERHWRILLAMGWLMGACANPRWEDERFHLTGALSGQTCTLRYGGIPGLPTAGGGALIVQTTRLSRPAPGRGVQAPGDDVQSIDCAGFDILLRGPAGGIVVPGTYSVTNERSVIPPTGKVLVMLEDVRIAKGWWPFALRGNIRFIGVGGTVRIDSTAAKVVYGHFDIVGHRDIGSI